MRHAGARAYPLIATLFFISGSTGLLYEVAFSKLLAYVFGATAYAVSTVLAAFMGGLALGAHFGGRNAAKTTRPLMVYGALEVIVGLVCAVSPPALAALTEIYVSLARAAPGSLAALTVLRAALTALVVVVPTVAMGATLPLLSRVVAGASRHGDAKEESGRRLGGLYAINTAGGAMGALLSAYAILPALGVRGTMRAAAIANVVIGVIAFLRGRAMPVETAPATTAIADAEVVVNAAESSAPARAPVPMARAEARPHAAHSSADSLLLGLALASGFLVFAAEVIQTHLLALLIGNSAYAFGLMLAVFLVCLSIGAARAPAFAKKHGDGALARGLAIAAFAVVITLPLWDELPIFFPFAGKHVHSWAGREIVRALAALVILALPTLWMGTTFPLLLQRVAARPDVAVHVGRLTVANTIGTILGSILTGYLILPTLGSERGLLFVAAAFAGASFLAVKGLDGSERRRALITGAASIALALLLPRWDMARLTSGANVYFVMGPPPEAIEFLREDVHGGVTTVTRRDGVHTLYTNGKFQGDDGAEMMAQRRFVHFPSLFVTREKRALVIGLGTGVTLGTVASYAYEHIDVAEISPSIAEAAKRFYDGPSLFALEDPRVQLDLNDGRNLLLVQTEPYDLITMELSSIWFAGAASLYSQEFYQLCEARLTSHGILQQWVQLHHLRRRELAAILRTIRSVFPHVALFIGGKQGILVASQDPLVASAAHLKDLETRPSVRATLNGASAMDVLGELVLSETDLDRYIADAARDDGGPIISTDDNLYLEYATPKGNVMNYDVSLGETIAELERYKSPDVTAQHLGP